MNESANNQEAPKKESWWQRLQHGQALVEYWPTLPAGVMVMISAAAIVGPVQRAFQTTADSMSGLTCEAPQIGPMEVDLDGGHHVEVVSSNYNGSETTVVFNVSSGDQPCISHWVLGIDEETADRIVYSSEPYVKHFNNPDPTTGKYGIKFDTGFNCDSGSSSTGKDKVKGNNGVGNGEDPQPPGNPPINDGEGTGPGNPGNKGGAKKGRVITTFSPRMNTYADEREIVLTFTGRVDFVETIEVTTKAGSDQVSSGYISIPTTGGDGSVNPEDAC